MANAPKTTAVTRCGLCGAHRDVFVCDAYRCPMMARQLDAAKAEVATWSVGKQSAMRSAAKQVGGKQ